ncbi:Myb-like DNA-binding domain protein [Ancylostoma duodenale]|uniref:Myb-like DNA-binding domain protein n=1 Tax=Ancylostoma duodenale TaxID=51022 RepID=A0A0C2GDU4_9BILA|nr:Myb-like DNA-binding domain protein [Ancylostoma duodenale]
MLARRSRLQVKPNISQGSKSGAKPPVEKVVEPTNSPSSNTAPAEQSSIADLAASLDNPTAAEHASEEAGEPGHSSGKAIPIAEPAEPPAVPPEEPEIGFIDPLAPERRVAQPRRKFTGDEELDPKKMRMMDMIYWNPKKEKGMSRKYTDTESVVGEKPAQSSEKQASVGGSAKSAAPQVKIGADGRLVIDEDSLVVAKETTNESIWETVEEDRMTRKVTSLSFRNRMWRKGTAWTEKETELFYEILRCTGPDFGLMHEFFPSRARNELKSKFNKEERTNWEKLKEVVEVKRKRG